MDSGQSHAGGPVPVLSYADGIADHQAAEWRELPDGVELEIPPPAVGRQVVPPAIRLVVAIPLFLLAGLATLGAASKPRLAGALVWGAITLLMLRWGLSAARRLVRAARYGVRPTVISTSPEWLTMVSPWLPEDRPYRLPRTSITGLRLDEVNTLPAIVRTVRLRVVLRHEDLFDLRFPWRANFSLAHAERRLHDALALGPRNFSPPLAAVRKTTDPCESSS